MGDSTRDPIEELTELFLGDLPRADHPRGSAFEVDDLPLPPYKSDSPKAAPKRDIPAQINQPAIDPVARHAPLTVQTEVVVIGHLPVAASAWVHHYAAHRQRQVGSPVALLRWRGDTASLDLFGVAAAPRRDLGTHASLGDAVRAAARVADTLIVSVEETREIEASQVPGIKRVVILTGSHDTAVVACYRALKGLVQHESIRDGHAELAVVVLGGPEERSRPAVERLERTTLSYLSHTIRGEVVNDKITATRAVPMFVGQASGSPTAFLRGLIEPGPASAPSHHEAAASPACPASPALTPRFPGLRSVEARCPFAPAVEVAVSPEGDLHVLASAAQPAEVSKAVADLTACAAWVEVNAAVLRGAIPELAKRVAHTSTPPREHLVTTEPKLVRGLLDTRLRLHLDASGTLIDLN